MKKILGILLAVMLLLTGIALADDRLQSGDFIYELLNDGTARILEYTGSFAKNIHVPAFIDGYPVAVIGEEAFSYNRWTTDGVIVTLPDSITTLEEKAFYMSPIKQINIPASVTVIKPGALRMSVRVQYNLSKENSKYALINGNLYDKQKKEFLSWCGAENVDIPNGIKSIAPYAFSAYDWYGTPYDSCRISIPETVNLIGAYAFANLEFEGDTLHFSGVKSIGEGAFYHTAFEGLFILPTSVTTIPEYAFAEASWNISLSRSALVLHDQVESIKAHAFENAELSVKFSPDDQTGRINRLPEQLKEIGESAFKNCWGIFEDSLTLSDNLISIGDYAFQTKKSDGVINTGTIYPETIVLVGDLYGLGDDVFNDTIKLIVTEGSYSEIYARNEGYTYSYSGSTADDLSWLTE